MLTADDTQARVAAVNILQALVDDIGERRAAQQQSVAMYGNGAILIYAKIKVQQLCMEHSNAQARQELEHVMHFLTDAADGECVTLPSNRTGMMLHCPVACWSCVKQQKHVFWAAEV